MCADRANSASAWRYRQRAEGVTGRRCRPGKARGRPKSARPMLAATARSVAIQGGDLHLLPRVVKRRPVGARRRGLPCKKDGIPPLKSTRWWRHHRAAGKVADGRAAQDLLCTRTHICARAARPLLSAPGRDQRPVRKVYEEVAKARTKHDRAITWQSEPGMRLICRPAIHRQLGPGQEPFSRSVRGASRGR